MFGSTNRWKTDRSKQAQNIGTTASSIRAADFVGLGGSHAAIVTKAIVPGKTGQVKFQGSWWTARCHDGTTLLAGDVVQVMHRQNLTLYVEPLALLTLSLQQAALSFD